MYSQALTIFCVSAFACVYASPAARTSDALDSEGDPVSWLFTTYHNGGIITVNEGKTEFELDQVSKDVIAFSDRPQRLVKIIPSVQFEEAFNRPEIFGSDPPNAATQIKVKCEDDTFEFVDLIFEMLAVESFDADSVVYNINVLQSLNADGEPSDCIDLSKDGEYKLENHSSGVFIDDMVCFPDGCIPAVTWNDIQNAH